MPLVNGRILGQRISRMKLERHVEALDLRPERPVGLQVVINAGGAVAELAEAVHKRAAKSEFTYAPFELPRRKIGALHRQRSKAAEAAGPPSNLFGEKV